MSETTRLPRLLITGSRTHQWTAYDSQALLIAIRDIVGIPRYTYQKDPYHHGQEA